jgi:dihydrodipicolinate synthase/N-acetylneuraminate lyase
MLATPSSASEVALISPASLGGSAQKTAVAAPPALKTRTKDAGFQVLVGSAQTLLPSLERGAVGAILAFACPAPTACFEIYTAWRDGDRGLAQEKQERIAAAAKRIVGELGVPGLKYALDFNGYYGGPPRLPLLPPTADVKSEIEQLLVHIRN